MNIKEFSVKPIIASSIPLKNSDAWDDGSDDNNDDTKDESNDEAKINIHQNCWQECHYPQNTITSWSGPKFLYFT